MTSNSTWFFIFILLIALNIALEFMWKFILPAEPILLRWILIYLLVVVLCLWIIFGNGGNILAEFTKAQLFELQTNEDWKPQIYRVIAFGLLVFSTILFTIIVTK